MRTIIAVIVIALFTLACNLSASVPTVAPTPDIPQVTILDPPNNQPVIEGTEFTIDVLATDTTTGVARVEVRVDDVTLVTVSPTDNEVEERFRVQTNWRAQGIGLHVIQAVAYRPDDTPSDTAIINVEVLPRE